MKAINFYSIDNKIKCFYILHENPNFKKMLLNLQNQKNFKLLNPMNYLNFVALALQSEFILTDSGGVSEEGPSLRKKFIVRDETERPEILSSKYVKIISTDPSKILKILYNMRGKKLKQI